MYTHDLLSLSFSCPLCVRMRTRALSLFCFFHSLSLSFCLFLLLPLFFIPSRSPFFSPLLAQKYSNKQMGGEREGERKRAGEKEREGEDQSSQRQAFEFACACACVREYVCARVGVGWNLLTRDYIVTHSTHKLASLIYSLIARPRLNAHIRVASPPRHLGHRRILPHCSSVWGRCNRSRWRFGWSHSRSRNDSARALRKGPSGPWELHC